MGEKQMEGEEGPRRLTASPLDVAGIDLGVSTDEIVQLVAEGRRSRPPMIEKAATGKPIPALNADELAALEIREDLDLHPNILEFEGRKAFVVLLYDEYLEIEDRLQELKDIRVLRQAKALEADAPPIPLAEMRAGYGLSDAEG